MPAARFVAHRALHLALFLVLTCTFPFAAEAGSQTFTASGTFTVPSYSSLTVTVWGGGGGGARDAAGGCSGGAASAGGNSSFNTNVVGNGGSPGACGTPGSGGAGGTASGGGTNTTGTSGSPGSGNSGGNGGASPNGGSGGSGGANASGSAGNVQGGGGGAGGWFDSEFSVEAGGGGGGGGGYSQKTYSAGALTVGAGISVVVGAGGAGGDGFPSISFYDGGNGARGEVQITWTDPPRTITLNGNVRFLGNLTITGALSKASGTFAIDHPLAPLRKLLYHSFVESPDVKNIYNGIATLDKNGEVTIQLPYYWDALNRDPRYQFFPLYKAMPNLYIKEEEHDNRFTIAGGAPGGQVSWQITGTRHDPYILANPINVEVFKTDSTIVPKGQCLFEPLCR